MNEPEALFEEFRTLERIQRAKAEGQEETLFLEFKEAQLDPNERLLQDTKANARKAIGALHNTRGGIIVWGVEAKSSREGEPAFVTDLEPIKNLRKFTERLGDYHPLQYMPSGLQHVMVPSGADDEGFVVTYVPMSDGKPKMDVDGKFHYRTHTSSVKMDEDMVRALVLAKARPELKLVVRERKGKWLRNMRDFSYTSEATFTLHVMNAGLVIAKNLAFTVAAYRASIVGVNPKLVGTYTVIRGEVEGISQSNGLYHFPETQLFPGVAQQLAIVSVKSQGQGLSADFSLTVRIYGENFQSDIILTLADLAPENWTQENVN